MINKSRARKDKENTLKPSKPITKPIIAKVWKTSTNQRLVCIPKQFTDIQAGDFVKITKVDFVNAIKEEVTNGELP